MTNSNLSGNQTLSSDQSVFDAKEQALSQLEEKRSNPFLMAKYIPFAHASANPKVTLTPWGQDTNSLYWDKENQEFGIYSIFAPYYPQGQFDASGWIRYTSKNGYQWEDRGTPVTWETVTPPGAKTQHCVWGGGVLELGPELAPQTRFKAGTKLWYLTIVGPLQPAPGARIQDIGFGHSDDWSGPPEEVKVVIKNPGRPLTDEDFFDFRDAHVVEDLTNKQFVMAVSVSYGVAFYLSKDAENWGQEPSSVWVRPGAAIGVNSGVETPWLVPFNDGKIWALIYSDQSLDPEGPAYVLGNWDGEKFTPTGNPQKLGGGGAPDNYAFGLGVKDGRYIMSSWIGNWAYSASNTPYRGFKNIQSWLSYVDLSEDQTELLVTPFMPEGLTSVKIKPQTLGGYPSYCGLGDSFPIFELKDENGQDVVPGQAYMIKAKFSPVEGAPMPQQVNLNVHDYQCIENVQYFFFLTQGKGTYWRESEPNKPNGGLDAWNRSYTFPFYVEKDGSFSILLIVDTSSTELYQGNGKVQFPAMDFPLPDAQGIRLFASNQDGLPVPENVGQVAVEMEIIYLDR